MFIRTRTSLLSIVFVLGFGLIAGIPAVAQEKAATPAASTPRYKDANAPIADRVADLLPRMTLEEKVEQFASGWENQVRRNRPHRNLYQRRSAQDIRRRVGRE